MADRRKQRKSRYTADRNIPGSFEGETVTRRRMMVLTAHGLGAGAAAAIVLPALGFALGPVFDRQDAHWEDVGPVSDYFLADENGNFVLGAKTNKPIPLGRYIPHSITEVPDMGEAGKSTVYVRAKDPSIDKGPADQDTEFIAISTRCAHLGCPVRYVDAAQRFICPCHGGVYDFQGRRTGGPPVRPLDRFYTRVTKNQRVEVGPRFSVNDELRRFSPRDPGENLNGIGQYLYPARFSTAEK